ncbi:hypothetical protein [Hungatella effluvii]|nr:hypothetical protein [Hungatella effluvii]
MKKQTDHNGKVPDKLRIVKNGRIQMKKMQIIRLTVLIVTLLLMGINVFIRPLPDWTVRIDGIVMLVSVVMVSYGTIHIS